MQPERLATPQDIASVYRTTVGYVYKLASTKKWKRVRYDGRTYYYWDEAGSYLGK